MRVFCGAGKIAIVVNVSEVFHYAGGPFNNTIENPRVVGRDPEGRSYFSFACLKIQTGTAGCFKKLRSGSLAANGSSSKRDLQTSRALQSCYAKRRSTTTITRRHTPNITGGMRRT